MDRAKQSESRSLGPWSVALCLGLPLAVAETFLFAVSYTELRLVDRAVFVAFFGTSLACVWTLALGLGAALARTVASEKRASLAVGAGVALGALAVLLFRLALMLNAAELRVGSTPALVGVAACASASLVLGAAGWLLARSSLRSLRWSGLVPPSFGLLAFILFLLRAPAPSSPVPISGLGAPTDSPLSATDTNLLLITVDTLRADHLDAYGYGRSTAPTLHQLAERGVLFERAVVQRTNTAPSLATLLTGTYPPTHRVLNNGQRLQDFNLTLAEILSDAGYRTIASVSNPGLVDNGYGQGFGQYKQAEGINKILDKEFLESRYLNDVALPILDSVGDERFFMWLHYRDPHTPYLVPQDYVDLFTQDAYSALHGHYHVPIGSGRKGTMYPTAAVNDNNDMDWLIAQYDSEIRFNDESIAALLERLDADGLRDNTLIVMTADHGESMGEHGYYFEHGTLTKESNAHVPLIFSHPKLPAGLRVTETVSLVDVAPTLLDLLGLPIPPGIQGQSFAPLVLGRHFERKRKTHFIIGRYRFGYQNHAVTNDSYKLILRTNPFWLPVDSLASFLGALWVPEETFNIYHFRRLCHELYDLRSDPDEQRNLAGTGLAVEGELLDDLWQWIESAYHDGRHHETMASEVSQETLEALKALGYVDLDVKVRESGEPPSGEDEGR